jgi:hypothetical protein
MEVKDLVPGQIYEFDNDSGRLVKFFNDLAARYPEGAEAFMDQRIQDQFVKFRRFHVIRLVDGYRFFSDVGRDAQMAPVTKIFTKTALIRFLKEGETTIQPYSGLDMDVDNEIVALPGIRNWNPLNIPLAAAAAGRRKTKRKTRKTRKNGIKKYKK